MNKSQYILVGIAALLAIGVFTLALFSFFKPSKSPTVEQSIAPTPTATRLEPIAYDKEASDRMLDIVNNRRSFTTTDLQARKVLANKALTSSIIYESENVRLEYLSSPDQFMAEILTSNIDTAKSEAVAYLSSAGLSNDAICHLPLVFYLSIQARRSLSSTSPEFNPLAPGC